MINPEECLAWEHGKRVPCPGCGWDGTFCFQVDVPSKGVKA